jgi:hypothetical protein
MVRRAIVATKQSRAAAGRNAAQQQQLAVLLIAPASDLPNADAEQQRIINTLHPQCILGTVTTSDVLDAIQRDTFDVVWFLGHSGPAGLQLSDGVMPAERLTQILRQSPPRLVVLNSCSNFYTANQIHDYLQCAVIGTVLDAPDLDAFVTGAILANALAQGMDIVQAWQASRPPNNRVYVLLNGAIHLNGENDTDDTNRLILRTNADLHTEIAGVTRGMATQERTIQEMRREMAGVRAEQVRVREEVATASERYQPRSTGARAAAWLLGALLMIAAAGLIDFRDTLGVPTAAATLMAAFVSLVALWLAVWGLGFRLDKW